MRTVVLVVALSAACKDKPAKAPPADPGDPVAEVPGDAPQRHRSGTAEAGPHRDYPTAAAAGTDKLFFLEEPDRGPPAPAAFALPKDLAWRPSPYCEVDALGFACGGGSVTQVHWRAARANGMTVVQRLLGVFVAETYVWEAGKQRVHLDARGNVDEAYLFNQPGRFTGRERTGANALHGCGMNAVEGDKQQRVVERRCLQWLGGGMRDKSGVAKRTYAFDAHGFTTEERRFGLDGKPVEDKDGVHRVAYTRDASGRPTMERYFRADGTRATDTDGCAGAQYTYDASGAVALDTCIDANDAPAPNADGVTSSKYGYDFAGCLNHERYLDSRGAAVVDHLGLIGKDSLDDASCSPLAATCIGRDGKMAACGPGQPARREYAYDKRGRVVSMKTFDTDGNATADGSYHAQELRYSWDDAGNSTGVDCFDATGTAIQCGETGFHGWRATFDSAGHELVETFVDTDGKPATNMGIAQRRIRYDNYDHQAQAESLDANGKPLMSSGSSLRKNLWDASHRLFAIQLFDTAGEPAQFAACFIGATCPKDSWQAVRINRRPNGVVTNNQFFDADGQLVDTIDCASNPCFDSE